MGKNIKLIIGSTRQNRVGEAIAEWVNRHAVNQDNITVEIVDLKQVDLPAFDAPVPPAYAPSTTPDGIAWGKRIGDADGFIFVTAEYNRSIPSSLKNAIDYLATEWKAKPAVIVSYGYIDGGGSATNHLKDVLDWLKVKTIEPTVALQLTQDAFNEAGEFKDINATLHDSVSQLEEALKQLGDPVDAIKVLESAAA